MNVSSTPSTWQTDPESGISGDETPIASSGASTDIRHEQDNVKIMVVDDVPLNVKLVRAHLSAVGYRHFVLETDSTQALSLLHREDPDLLLLDLMMPQIDGLDILEAVRADPRFAHLPVLILTAATDRELKIRALELGATDFLNKPIDVQDLLPRVHNALLVKSHQDDLEAKVRQRTRELEVAQKEVLYRLACAAEYRDNETGHHVIRVSRYVGILARELGFDAGAQELMSQASTLHDMGKVGIPDSILLKPGKLSDEEFEVMKRHCEYGSDICGSSIGGRTTGDVLPATGGRRWLDGGTSPLMNMAGSIAATHHEKWDGSGYPRGLAGDEIPIEGRVTAVADVFDALSSKRPYKDPFPLEKCIAILKEGRGAHFDPHLVDLFLNHMDEVVTIRDQYAE